MRMIVCGMLVDGREWSSLCDSDPAQYSLTLSLVVDVNSLLGCLQYMRVPAFTSVATLYMLHA